MRISYGSSDVCSSDRRVEAPSGTATLELGLGTDGASHVAWNVETALGVRTLLDIAADGQIRLDGNLEVAGDIRLIDGPLTLEAAQGSNPAQNGRAHV